MKLIERNSKSQVTDTVTINPFYSDMKRLEQCSC